MDQRKKIVLGILVVSVFIFLVSVLVFVFALYQNGDNVPGFLQPFVDYHMQFMVLMGFFGIFSGVLVYSLMGSSIAKEQKAVKTNSDLILKFLGNEEREVFQLLTAKGGVSTQSEVAKLPGMTRLKAHRVVKKLEARGIIMIDKQGKMNLIRLVDDLKPLAKGSNTAETPPSNSSHPPTN